MPFSVAVYTGVYRCVVVKESIALSFTMGLFHAVLFSLGWMIGKAMSGSVASLAFPFAIFIIAFIGFRIFSESFRASALHKTIAVNEIGLHLLTSLAVSINAFLVGIALGLIKIALPIPLLLLVISVMLFSLAGSRFGAYGKIRIAQIAELSGGIILFLVAIGTMIGYLS